MSHLPSSDLRSRIIHLHTLGMSNEVIAAFVETLLDDVAVVVDERLAEQRARFMKRPKPKLKKRGPKPKPFAETAMGKRVAALREARAAEEQEAKAATKCPTPAEIDAERDAIQAGWIDVERRLRYRMARSIESVDEADDGWTARVCESDEMRMTDWSVG